jgi:hypothetical protein
MCLQYGKGTNSVEGVALLGACVHQFERRGADCPKVLIATHQHELFSLQILTENATTQFWVRKLGTPNNKMQPHHRYVCSCFDWLYIVSRWTT